jgi:hypothetical protein
MFSGGSVATVMAQGPPDGSLTATAVPLGDAGSGRRVLTRREERGQSMIEFALLAPAFFFVVLALVILGIVVLNQVELSNGLRDGARAGGICGSQLFNTSTTTQLPNGTLCTVPHLVTYVQSRISTIPGVTPVVSVDFSGGSSTSATTCSPGQKIKLTASYQQPLWVPLIGNFLGDTGNTGYRTVFANAEATCEQ